MTLLKLQKLAKLNEELKEFNKDYAYTKHLIENNIRMASKRWQEVNQEKEFNLIHTEYELEKRKKARLVDSRWLSDGTLEATFIDSNWETFYKVYNEDDFFATRQREREESVKQDEYRVNQAFQKFDFLTPKWSSQKNKEKFAFLKVGA